MDGAVAPELPKESWERRRLAEHATADRTLAQAQRSSDLPVPSGASRVLAITLPVLLPLLFPTEAGVSGLVMRP